MVDLAEKDGVKVLGINDFYSMGGFQEFFNLSVKKKIFPMLNVEFVALSQGYQSAGIRVNDPLNPGRVYLVGKGMSRHAEPSPKYVAVIQSQIEHIKKVIDRVNYHFYGIEPEFSVSYDSIRNSAKGFVGERHVAREIKRVFDVNMSEGDIRNKLLKKGGPCYVEESPTNFLSLEDCLEVIRTSGGLPCYPVLFDYGDNQFTEFEENLEKMYQSLTVMGIKHLDVIPDRNNLEHLTRLVKFFDAKGFYILMGSEHNTEKMKRLRVTNKDGSELSPELIDIAYKGCCSVAAHQIGVSHELTSIGEEVINSYT